MDQVIMSRIDTVAVPACMSWRRGGAGSVHIHSEEEEESEEQGH